MTTALEISELIGEVVALVKETEGNAMDCTPDLIEICCF